MTKLKMLRDSVDYKTGLVLCVDEVYELDRTENEIIVGVAHGIWAVVDSADDDTEEKLNG